MRSTSLIMFLLATGMLHAQPNAFIDYTTPGGRAVIGAQLAAGQLLSEFRLLAMSGGAQPANVQQELQNGCNRATVQINALYRTIQVGTNWAVLQPQVDIVNRSVSEACAFVRQNAPNDRSLTLAIGRVEFAWQRTQALLARGFGGFNPVNPIGPVVGPQQAQIVALARSLDRQSDLLAIVGQQTLPNNVGGEQLEQSIRDFAASCDRLSGHIERGEPFAVSLAHVKTRWDTLAGTLGGVQLHQFVGVRLQAARVDQLYRALLLAVGQQQIPQPAFWLNNQKLHGAIAIGAGEGGQPIVRVYSDRRGGEFHDFMAYDPSFQGGVRVAVGDVNGDGVVDIVTAPGKGMPPLVRVFDGRDLSLLSQFYAYDPNFLSGVFVAAADVTGDGRAEIVCGAGDPGGPHVRAFDGMTGQAYDQRLQCGVRVALGDVDGDRIPDIITAPGPGIAPVVRIYRNRDGQLDREFSAFDPLFRGGAWVAGN